jgi:tetratricopeptide (TPR) repeat protein
MIAGATSVNERNLYTDSLMMLYDMRAEHFADDARYGLSYILKGKAKDYYNYRASDKPGVLKVFQDAIAASESVDAEFTAQYFQVLTEQYQDLEIETEYYMDEYDRVAKLMATTGDQKYIDTFENLFINSGAANCENLEKIYKPRFEGGNADVAQVKKAFALLSRSECLTPFFFEVGDMLLAQEATAETAMALAKGYEKNGDLTKSIEYLTKAIEAEQDPITKSQLAIQIAGNEILNDNPRNAANFAKQAIEINPESAMAYIVLAQASAAGSGACADFERLTVYWLAYDTVLNARRLLEEGDPQLQTVEQLAQSFRNSFPNKEECFFRGLSVGNAYTVNCGWISGRTTVKEGR